MAGVFPPKVSCVNILIIILTAALHVRAIIVAESYLPTVVHQESYYYHKMYSSTVSQYLKRTTRPYLVALYVEYSTFSRQLFLVKVALL